MYLCGPFYFFVHCKYHVMIRRGNGLRGKAVLMRLKHLVMFNTTEVCFTRPTTVTSMDIFTLNSQFFIMKHFKPTQK